MQMLATIAQRLSAAAPPYYLSFQPRSGAGPSLQFNTDRKPWPPTEGLALLFAMRIADTPAFRLSSSRQSSGTTEDLQHDWATLLSIEQLPDSSSKLFNGSPQLSSFATYLQLKYNSRSSTLGLFVMIKDADNRVTSERAEFAKYRVPADRWLHVCVTYRGTLDAAMRSPFARSAGIATLFVNGLLVADPCSVYYAPPVPSRLHCEIDPGTGHSQLHWQMGNFYVFQRALLSASAAFSIFVASPNLANFQTSTRPLPNFECINHETLTRLEATGVQPLSAMKRGLDVPNLSDGLAFWVRARGPVVFQTTVSSSPIDVAAGRDKRDMFAARNTSLTDILVHSILNPSSDVVSRSQSSANLDSSMLTPVAEGSVPVTPVKDAGAVSPSSSVRRGASNILSQSGRAVKASALSMISRASSLLGGDRFDSTSRKLTSSRASGAVDPSLLYMSSALPRAIAANVANSANVSTLPCEAHERMQSCEQFGVHHSAGRHERAVLSAGQGHSGRGGAVRRSQHHLRMSQVQPRQRG